MNDEIAASPAGAPAQEPAGLLTDEEIDILQEEYDCCGGNDAPRIHDFARAIERRVRATPPRVPESPLQVLREKGWRLRRTRDGRITASSAGRKVTLRDPDSVLFALCSDLHRA